MYPFIISLAAPCYDQTRMQNGLEWLIGTR